MLGLIGKKLGHTRVYDESGNIVPVTVVLAGPNRVVQCKTVETDGYSAVQLGFDDQKSQRINKAQAGHFKKNGSEPTRKVREFRDFPLEVKSGDIVGPNVFAAGDYVDAIATTKGRGFQGVMKRWDFAGGPGSHGHKGFKRRTGAIGQRLFPGTVMKGQKMPGHMGGVRRTAQNLQVVKILEEDNIILIKGCMPGSEGDYVILREAKKRPKMAAKQ